MSHFSVYLDDYNFFSHFILIPSLNLFEHITSFYSVLDFIELTGSNTQFFILCTTINSDFLCINIGTLNSKLNKK